MKPGSPSVSTPLPHMAVIKDLVVDLLKFSLNTHMLSHGYKHHLRPQIRNGGKRQWTAPRWTDCMSASYAPAARQPVRATGGTEIDSWGPQRSCMPGGGSSTLVMKPLVIASTSSMIRSNCSDAVLFLTAQMYALKV